MDQFIWYFFLLVSVALINAQVTRDDPDTTASSQGDSSTGNGSRDTTTSSQGNGSRDTTTSSQGDSSTGIGSRDTTASSQGDSSTDMTTSSQGNNSTGNGTEACVNATVADVVFLVDSSGSIGSTNFQEVRGFLRTVVSGLDIGPDNVRVGLVQFDQDPVLEFSLLEHMDKDSLLAELGNLPYLRGRTRTGRAIDFIRTQLFNESAGSRANQGVPQIAVVITDGASDDDVVQPAVRLRQHGVIVFAIGVGVVNVTELEAIANQPSEDFRFLIDNFQSLQRLSQVVLETVCDTIINPNPTQVPGPPDEDDPVIKGRVYLHIKAQVNFTLGVNVTEVLQQFIINATREFCDDCQLDFNTTTVTIDQSP